MTLTIHKLNTHCRSPKGLERLRGVAEDAASGLLASELSAHLGPSLDRLPPVVRLNELRVKVSIAASDISAFTLANAWARAFTLALHQTLARPPGDGKSGSRRYESESAYKAALLLHILRNGVRSSWEFPELARWQGHSVSATMLGVLLAEPPKIADTIVELQRLGSLESVLALFDESALEELMCALEQDCEPALGLRLESLVEVGSAAGATAGVFGKWALNNRRQAIRLWARTGRRLPLRSLWHGLRLLQRFLEMPSLLRSPDPTLLADAIPFPEWCMALVTDAARAVHGKSDSVKMSVQAIGETRHLGQSSAAPANLLAVLEALRPLVPSSANPATMRSSAQWIASDSAGLLLMLSVARRLDLWRFARNSEFLKFGGPRAFSFFLAGIGMSLLSPRNTTDSIEPAVAIFAGILNEPDLSGMKHFVASAESSAVHDFVAAKNWLDAFQSAATMMAQTFGSLVRGFRSAPRDAIVRQFIRVPGRILVEESRVLVVLASNPWAVALRLSRMDDRLSSVEWLGYRSVEFVLEGL